MPRIILSAAVASLLALPSAAQDGGKVKLEWKFKKGDTHRYEILTNIQLEVPGMALSQDTILGLSMEVTDVTAEGTGTIKATFDRVRYKMAYRAEAFDFDSDSDQKKPAGDFASRVLSSLVGKSMTMTLSRRGDCLKVEGIDEVLAGAVREFPENMKALGEVLRKSLSDDRMKGLMKMSMGCLPANAVGKGESWDGTSSVSMGVMGKVNTATKATLIEVRADGGEALIGLDTKVALETGADGWPVPLMEIADAKMISEMVWLVDRGLMQSTKGEMKFELSAPPDHRLIAAIVKQEMKLAPRAKKAPPKESK
jgi:hypothetical protein